MRLFRPARTVSIPAIKPVCAAALLALSSMAHASENGLVISQVYGGGQATTGSPSFKQDYVELFNAGASSVSLAGLSLQYGSATGNLGSPVLLDTGSITTLAPGQYVLVGLGSGTLGPTLPLTDISGSTSASASNGKFALVAGTTALACGATGTSATPCPAAKLGLIIDLVGYGSATMSEGSAVAALSSTTAALRANGGCTDAGNNSTDFATGTPVPRNSSSPLNACSVSNQPIVASCPAINLQAGTGGAVSISASDADGIVNEVAFVPAPPTGVTFGPFFPAATNGGTANGQILVGSSVPAGSYPMLLEWTNNQNQTSACTVNLTVSPATATSTPIAQIQGQGSTSPLAGQTVTTQGVVTKLTNSGFFMQSMVPDLNQDTSDGIFVFTSTAPTVSVGNEVRLTGLVEEFDVSLSAANPQAEAHTVTQLKTISGLTVLSTGHAINPTPITFPEVNEDDLEKVEGMLVTINTPLTVSQNYFLGRYGQVTLSAEGRLIKPTNKYTAGSVDAINLAADNARRRILLDDGSTLQNPNPTPYIGSDNTLRAGDTIASLTGVIDYKLATSATNGLADYAIHPAQSVSFTRSHPRTAAPSSVGNSNVKVASFNVLNFFTTFVNGSTVDGLTGQGCSLGASVSASNCRGANNLTEFNRQRDKIVRAMAAINADVVGLMEIQNNGNTAVQNLVDALNAHMGTGTYAAVSLPSSLTGGGSGTGTDAIRVAMIYKPARLATVGQSVSDTNAIHNRPPLAQTFSAANGEKFTVLVNHFKSKGSCPAPGDADYPSNYDSGDGQGCWNGRRQQQASQLHDFITAIQNTQQDADTLVIGDLNAYGKEDPILTLTNSHGLTDLLETYVGTSDYSYVFDGEAGYLDHALATPSLVSQVTGAVHWHINADEPTIIDYNLEFKQPACATCGPDYYSQSPYRSSDHDPVVIGLNLVKRITGTTRGDTITGTAGDDRITGGEGADLITGGAGRDVFVYNSLRDAFDAITDFTPGVDRVDLSAIAASLRANNPGVDLLTAGFFQLTDGSAGVQIRLDADGLAGTASARPLVTLRGVTAAQIVAARDLIL